MSDITNLIYNGDFSQGTDSWSGSGLTVSNGIATLTGDLSQDIYIPVASNRRYRLSYDIKFNTIGNQRFYISLKPYDNDKVLIPIANTYKPVGSTATNTTLAVELKSGDTTVTLTSGANWPTNRTYQRIGICQSNAWGYNRATTSFRYSSISGNVITLGSTYTGSTIPAGTKVAEFEDGSTYYYPHSLPQSGLPTTWTTYTVEFTGGNTMRYSCQYFKFSTLGYSHNYSMRNIRIECISDYQECPVGNSSIQPQFYKNGIISGISFHNVGLNIRYIRDSMAGNTVNTNNHWNEVQVFNNVDENIAWGKDIKITNTNYSNSVVTDGTVNSSYLGGNTSSYFLLDLGYIENVTRIKIYHYYSDGRSYHNCKTEVSLDGVTWYTVFESTEEPATSRGIEIILNPSMMSIYDGGFIESTNFIEY